MLIHNTDIIRLIPVLSGFLAAAIFFIVVLRRSDSSAGMEERWVIFDDFNMAAFQCKNLAH